MKREEKKTLRITFLFFDFPTDGHFILGEAQNHTFPTYILVASLFIANFFFVF